MNQSLDQVRHALAGYRPMVDRDDAARPAAVALVLEEGPEGLAALFIKRAARGRGPVVGTDRVSGGPLPGERRRSFHHRHLAKLERKRGSTCAVPRGSAPWTTSTRALPVLPPIVVRPFVFVVAERPALVVSPEEVERAFWISFAHLEAPETGQEITLNIRGAERTFPAYQIGGDVIWGMTERILTSFLDRIRYSPA